MCQNYFFYTLGDDDGAVIVVYLWWVGALWWTVAGMMYPGVGQGAVGTGIVCRGWRRI